MNHSCEVCKKKIEEPLYWADPKFYDIPKIVFFVMPNVHLFITRKLKIYLKFNKFNIFSCAKFAQLISVICNLTLNKNLV